MTNLPQYSEKAIFKRKWLEKSGTFMAILVFNFCILLLIGSQVIYTHFLENIDTPVVYVKIKPPPPPIKPPAKGGDAAKSLADPSVQVVPPAVTSAMILSQNSSQINFAPSLTTDSTVSLTLPSFSAPSGSGLGSGTSGNPIPQSNPFGDAPQSGVPGLLGELYDLKQTPDGTPTPVAIVPPELVKHISPEWAKLPATAAGLKVLRQYVLNWDQSILDQYYKSPKPLQTVQLFIPLRASELATQAFGVADKVSARRWVIHYHGTIVPTTSSQYRFMGYGDDFLVVRLDNTNVLDGSIRSEWLDHAANGPRQETVPGPNGHDLYCGQWFNTSQGVPIPIDILIGEGPGGVSGFTLLVEEKGDTSTPGDYPVFQVAPAPLAKLSKVTSSFSGKTLVFPAQ